MVFAVMHVPRVQGAAVQVGELDLFVGPNYVLSVRHGFEPGFQAVRDRVESEPGLLRLGPGFVFYGPMDQHHSHAHDAVAAVDRVPFFLMMACSIGFFLFPGHFYSVVRAGVDPLVARISKVVPVATIEPSADRAVGLASSPPGSIAPRQEARRP